MNTTLVDVVLDLARGDSGKGKISHDLLRKTKYTHVLRWNGSGNAGHTIYHNNKKFVTHLIPAGVFYQIPSIIGPGCVLNVNKFFQEIEYLENNGLENVRNIVKVAKNTHVVTEEHIAEEQGESAVGTTRTGNGPCYRDKYARTGVKAENIKELEPFLVDMYELFYERNNGGDSVVLAEGAQGFYLDIDWGDYPYVTSSHCGIGGVLLNGFTHKQVRTVYGCIKAYETYVGSKKFEPTNDSIFEEIRKTGQEWGATTGRPRQCNWTNLNEVKKAATLNSVDILVVNKLDILRTLNVWKLYLDNKVVSFSCEEDFKKAIVEYVPVKQVVFSDNPYHL